MDNDQKDRDIYSHDKVRQIYEKLIL